MWWPETGLNRRRLDFSGPRAELGALRAQSPRARLLDLSVIEEWWPETGLNRRRRPFQGRALPLSYLASVGKCEVLLEKYIGRGRAESLCGPRNACGSESGGVTLLENCGDDCGVVMGDDVLECAVGEAVPK